MGDFGICFQIFLVTLPEIMLKYLLIGSYV
jgi:hypothetical protein